MTGIRYSIDLDKELHKKYKLLSLEKETSMRKLVIKALEQFLIKDKNEKVRSERGGPVANSHRNNTGAG